MFFEHFPMRLKDNPAQAEVVERLCGLLSTSPKRRDFRRAIDLDGSINVSVFELRAGFSDDADLAQQVTQLLQKVRRDARSSPRVPNSAASSFSAQGVEVESYKGRLYALPELGTSYLGRKEEAQQLAEYLQNRGSLVLLAPGGMGKSSLAADVGWRLYGAGALPGGAFWADLREARTAEDVEARFCAALNLQRVSEFLVPFCPAFGWLCIYRGHHVALMTPTHHMLGVLVTQMRVHTLAHTCAHTRVRCYDLRRTQLMTGFSFNLILVSYLLHSTSPRSAGYACVNAGCQEQRAADCCGTPLRGRRCDQPAAGRGRMRCATGGRQRGKRAGG